MIRTEEFTHEDFEEANRIIAEKSGQSVEKVTKDSERDHYMSAEEACAYGLIDKVVSTPVST